MSKFKIPATELTRGEIKMTINRLYPDCPNIMAARDDARSCISLIETKGTETEKKVLVEELSMVMDRAVSDALAETVDVRVAAKNFFDDVRLKGTQSEKTLALQSLEDVVIGQMKKSHLQTDITKMERAAEMLGLLMDSSAAKLLYEASAKLEKSGNTEFDRVAAYLSRVASELKEAEAQKSRIGAFVKGEISG